MIADIALGLSVFNLLIWVVVVIGIRRLFQKMLPVLNSFGIGKSQNLMYSPVYDRIGVPDELPDAEKET